MRDTEPDRCALNGFRSSGEGWVAGLASSRASRSRRSVVPVVPVSVARGGTPMKLTIKKVAKPEMGKVRGVITCG